MVGLLLWRSTSVALAAIAAPPPTKASAPLVVGVETSVTAAAATAALGMPVMPVRTSWPPSRVAVPEVVLTVVTVRTVAWTAATAVAVDKLPLVAAMPSGQARRQTTLLGPAAP